MKRSPRKSPHEQLEDYDDIDLEDAPDEGVKLAAKLPLPAYGITKDYYRECSDGFGETLFRLNTPKAGGDSI